MAKQLHTSIRIQATPATIWNILMDFEHYPDWNPFVRAISGEARQGGRLRVELPGLTVKPTVLTCRKNTEFVWLGHLGIKGLFDGAHRFRLVDNGDGTTTFEHSETFRGLLVPVLWKRLESETRNGFEAMNRALKVRAEQAAG